MKHKYRDRFFADPFLWYETTDYYYILAEEYIFYEKKGKISLLIVQKSDLSLIKKKVIIEEHFHLSFPSCNLNSDIITLESNESGKCYEYTLSKSTHTVIDRKILINKPLVDPIVIKIKNSDWLLASHRVDPKEKLYLYKKNEKGFVLIKSNPVKVDISSARNAGNIFKLDNYYIRPAQDCLKTYGHQIKLMRIKSISDDSYIESEIAILNNEACKKFNETMHTFNVYNNIIIIDGSKDLIRFPMKIIYKIREIIRKRVKR
jgi:hypothetical protein